MFLRQSRRKHLNNITQVANGLEIPKVAETAFEVRLADTALESANSPIQPSNPELALATPSLRI